MADGAGNYVSYTLERDGNRRLECLWTQSNTCHALHSWVFTPWDELYQDIKRSRAATNAGLRGEPATRYRARRHCPRTTASQYDALIVLNQVHRPGGGITQLGYDANDKCRERHAIRCRLQTTYVLRMGLAS